jgi:hypothetical protein
MINEELKFGGPISRKVERAFQPIEDTGHTLIERAAKGQALRELQRLRMRGLLRVKVRGDIVNFLGAPMVRY